MSLENNLRVSFNSGDNHLTQVILSTGQHESLNWENRNNLNGRDDRINHEIVESPNRLFRKKINEYYPTVLIFYLSISFLIINILILCMEKELNLIFRLELDTLAFVITNQYILVVSISNITYGLIAFISGKKF